MSLTPEEIRNRAFKTDSGGGYDRGEVDAFLAQVADEYSAATRRLAAAAEGDSADYVAAELAEVLRAARESANRVREKAQVGADGLFAAASKRADELRAGAERANSEAQAEARHIIEGAEQKARELRALAKRQQDELTDQTEHRHVALTRYRQQLRDRIISLEALTGEMLAQIDGVEEPAARPRRPAQRRRSLHSKEDSGQEAEPGSTIILDPSTAPVETGGGTPPGLPKTP